MFWVYFKWQYAANNIIWTTSSYHSLRVTTLETKWGGRKKRINSYVFPYNMHAYVYNLLILTSSTSYLLLWLQKCKMLHLIFLLGHKRTQRFTCYRRQNFDKWIIIAVHRSSEKCNVWMQTLFHMGFLYVALGFVALCCSNVNTNAISYEFPLCCIRYCDMALLQCECGLNSTISCFLVVCF